ncbi:hypothetical protein EBX93_18275, partial [bacterium]|nr:hypothetical protein [bacterium]
MADGGFNLTVSGNVAGSGGNYSTSTGGKVIMNGTSKTISSSGTHTFQNLDLQNGSSISLSSTSLNVNGVFTLTSGTLNIGSNNLVLGSSASFSGTPSSTNMIIADGGGEVRKTTTATGSFTFPIGDNTSTAEYSPVIVNVTAGSFSSAYTSVKVTNAKHTDNASPTHFINRYWTIGQSGITGGTVTLNGTYTNADIAGTETSASAAVLNGTF